MIEAMAGERGRLYSADAAWWWSGDGWMPTVSPDGGWRWNGRAWVRTNRVLPRWIFWATAGWLGLLVGSVAVVSALIFGDSDPVAIERTAVSLGSIAVLATIALGASLGSNRRWPQIAFAALAGTICLAACYLVLMLSVPDPQGTQDIAAGAGLAILGPPTLLGIATLLGLGGAVGHVVGERKRRQALQ